MGIKIIATGAYLPHHIVYNDYFEDKRMVYDKTLDEFFRGTVERRHASQDETAEYMAIEAGRRALEEAQINPSSIDFLIGSIELSEHHTPKPEYFVIKELGLSNADTIDINVCCATFLSMLNIAHSLILSGKYKRIMLIHSNRFTKTGMDPKKNYSGVGDGAAAVIVEKSENDSFMGMNKDISPELFGFTGLKNAQLTGKAEYLYFSDDDNFKRNMMTIIAPVAVELLKKENITPNQIDWLIMHQPGLPAMDFWRETTGIPPEKHLHTFEKYANLFGANIPVTLDFYIKEKTIKRGDIILMLAPGSGQHTISMLWEY